MFRKNTERILGFSPQASYTSETDRIHWNILPFVWNISTFFFFVSLGIFVHRNFVLSLIRMHEMFQVCVCVYVETTVLRHNVDSSINTARSIYPSIDINVVHPIVGIDITTTVGHKHTPETCIAINVYGCVYVCVFVRRTDMSRQENRRPLQSSKECIHRQRHIIHLRDARANGIKRYDHHYFACALHL